MKNILLTLILGTICVAASQANAEENSAYVGLGYYNYALTYEDPWGSSQESTYSGPNLKAGYDFSRFFGIGTNIYSVTRDDCSGCNAWTGVDVFWRAGYIGTGFNAAVVADYFSESTSGRTDDGLGLGLLLGWSWSSMSVQLEASGKSYLSNDVGDLTSITQALNFMYRF